MRSDFLSTPHRQALRFFSQCRRLGAQDGLPSIAPRPTISIKHIRQNPELYFQNCLERNYKAQSDHPFKIVSLYERWQQSQENTRRLRQKSNALQRNISAMKSFDKPELEGSEPDKGSADILVGQLRKLQIELSVTHTVDAQMLSQIVSLGGELPNLTSPETPRDQATVVGYINEDLKPPADQPDSGSVFPRDHSSIGAELDLLDFSGAATSSGWGWYYLKNEAALLEQALVQYALSIAMKHGFTVVTPPSMVYSHIASACGFRPRDQSGEQQVYSIQQIAKDQGKDKPSYSLAGTAEIPFAGMKANRILQKEELPIMVVGPSRCYRAEAGARGADTKGLYRVHEFTKVEMFAWTVPTKEDEIFETMQKVQIEILQGLGLHCRILEMPSPDLGASAYRKRDIEAYFPSRRDLNEGWGEVTSTSICTDYQTRRLNTRAKNLFGTEGKMVFPHTVNGTAVAVPRVLAALLERHAEEKDGRTCVGIPEVLWPWMHGIRRIEKERPGVVEGVQESKEIGGHPA